MEDLGRSEALTENKTLLDKSTQIPVTQLCQETSVRTWEGN